MPFTNFHHLLSFLQENKFSFLTFNQVGYVEVYTPSEDFVIYDRKDTQEHKYYSEGWSVRSLYDINLKSELLVARDFLRKTCTSLNY